MDNEEKVTDEKTVEKAPDVKTEEKPKAAAEDEDRAPEAIVVRNKDIMLLEQILPIMQDIRLTEEQAEWTRERMTSTTQCITGMPGAHGNPKGMDDAFARLYEAAERHDNHIRDYTRMLKKAEKILNGISSISMRTFVLMRYAWDIPDTEIRAEMNLTRRGFDRARRAVETAEDMAHVKWVDRYILESDTQKGQG